MNHLNLIQYLQNLIIQLQNQINQLPANQMNNQMQFLQNQINQLQNEMNQIPANQINEFQLNNFIMRVHSFENQFNLLNNNFNNNNQQPTFFNINIPIEIPQSVFPPAIQPQENTTELPIYNVRFYNSNGNKINCQVPSDSSIENMIQIYKNKTSIDLKDCIFMYNNKKIDINSQIKIKEFFPIFNNPIVYAYGL